MVNPYTLTSLKSAHTAEPVPNLRNIHLNSSKSVLQYNMNTISALYLFIYLLLLLLLFFM